MKKSVFLIIIVVCVCSMLVKGQQLPQYSQYMVNDYVLNPAVGGKKPYFEAKSSNRYQWVGITDAPRTYILSLNGPYRSAKVGLGGYLFTDIVGPTRRTGLYFSYAYHMKLKETLKLSLGLSGGVLQFMIDGSKIILKDKVDLSISNGIQSVVTPDFGFGFYLYTTDQKFYLGASVPQILQNKLRFFDYSVSTLSRLVLHYYVTSGYRFDLNDDFAIEPSTVVKFVFPAPPQFDLGARVFYKEKIWLGGAYRTRDAIAAMLGYTYRENLNFAYSYDFTSSNIKNYSSGTHELMIGIKFNKLENK